MNDSSPGESSLQHEIQSRARRILPGDLAAKMGYHKVDQSVLKRLNDVIHDEFLGLQRGGFDFRYDSEQFLEALCAALDIAPSLRDVELARLRAIIRQREAFIPDVFIDTGFRRANHPLFAMAAMENRRHIRFEPSFRDQSLFSQIQQVRRCVREHFRINEGSIPMWGAVRRYLFHYGPQHVLILNTDGEVIGESDDVRYGQTVSRLESDVGNILSMRSDDDWN